MEYTKGEWEVKQTPHGDYELTSEVVGENVCVACVYLVPIASADGETSLGTAKANAHLIAAAPAMYEALELALDFFTEYDIQNKVISGLSLKLNEALAQAEGKEV